MLMSIICLAMTLTMTSLTVNGNPYKHLPPQYQHHYQQFQPQQYQPPPHMRGPQAQLPPQVQLSPQVQLPAQAQKATDNGQSEKNSKLIEDLQKQVDQLKNQINAQKVKELRDKEEKSKEELKRREKLAQEEKAKLAKLKEEEKKLKATIKGSPISGGTPVLLPTGTVIGTSVLSQPVETKSGIIENPVAGTVIGTSILSQSSAAETKSENPVQPTVVLAGTDSAMSGTLGVSSVAGSESKVESSPVDGTNSDKQTDKTETAVVASSEVSDAIRTVRAALERSYLFKHKAEEARKKHHQHNQQPQRGEKYDNKKEEEIEKPKRVIPCEDEELENPMLAC